MYAASLYVWQSVKLNIHNQCLSVDLIFPIYITHDELECHIPLDYEVCAGNTMKSGFIDKSYDVPYGALIYKLQRRLSNQTIETSKCASSIAYLLVAWRISESKVLYADILLIEYDEEFDWSKDNLRELHFKNFDRFRMCPDSATKTWLLGADAALMTTFEIMNRDYILDITISEVGIDNYVRTPVHIDKGR
jgi:hypothetical protein